jgi:hypothetical protein
MQLLYATGFARVPPEQRRVAWGRKVPGGAPPPPPPRFYGSSARWRPSLGPEERHDDVREQRRGALCPARKFRAIQHRRTQGGGKTRALLSGSTERPLGVGRYVARTKRIV